ncbi:DUF4355 domain-containing protein [Cellulosilyticum sp. I15G10I2]|uniref:DUF4355 domain-containing protein n=1 Tax=Cellulosilyticum sp. I15G10I2 TaxID=1892843 RepID=UPI00085C378A|nr:DUF4355 domain-containing protein [Cellulosilyticum sp. I15G10I2]
MEDNQNVNVEQEELETNENKTYTQDEMLALIQSETDKRVAQALKTQQKKFEKEMAKNKSLSALDEEGRAKAEKDMRIQELEDQLQQFRLTNTKVEIGKVLSNRGLDANLVDYVVVSDDADEAMERIEKLDKIFKNMVKIEIEKRLNTSNPKVSTVGLDGQITKEQFNKMTIQQQTDLYKNNKDLYMQLTNK